MKNKYRKIRIGLAVVFFACLNLFFMGAFDMLGWTVKAQFMPAVLRTSAIVIALVLLLTFLLGRIYCSVICPLGVMQDCFIWLSRKFNKRKKYGYSKPKNILRYTVLVLFILALVIGGTWAAGIIEPYSIYGRFFTNLFKPVLLAANNLLVPLSDKMEWYCFVRSEIFIQSLVALSLSIVLFVLIGFMSYRWGRTWCNTLCPVGSFLGLISRYSCLKITINTDKCNHCLSCGRKCKASCINSKEQKIDYSRCVDCFDCIDACNQHALSWSPVWGSKKAPQNAEEIKSVEPEAKSDEAVDESRRHFLVTALMATVGTQAALAETKVNTAVATALHKQPVKRKFPILPPGAMSLIHFQQHCTSCHLCVSKCPQKVLRPATGEYGLNGLMQPTMKYDRGYCDINCHVCSEVCPAEAIRPLTLDEKKKTRIGYAVYTQKNCLVLTDDLICGNCARHCPVNAISMVDLDDDHMVPMVNVNKCIGCGSCEYHCPAKPFSAIHVEGYDVQKKIQK